MSLVNNTIDDCSAAGIDFNIYDEYGSVITVDVFNNLLASNLVGIGGVPLNSHVTLRNNGYASNGSDHSITGATVTNEIYLGAINPFDTPDEFGAKYLIDPGNAYQLENSGYDPESKGMPGFYNYIYSNDLTDSAPVDIGYHYPHPTMVGQEGYFTKLFLLDKADDADNAVLSRGENNLLYAPITVLGSGCNALGQYAHAEGLNTTASGLASHAEGSNTVASAYFAHAEGRGTLASGGLAHAEGAEAEASGFASHAEGQETFATAQAAHVEGIGSHATGITSHAEGQYTRADGNFSHSQGWHTKARGIASFAFGNEAIANKDFSVAGGYCAIADHTNSFIFATGETNEYKTTLYPNAAHFDNLLLLEGALDHDQSVLSRAENDDRYGRYTFRYDSYDEPACPVTPGMDVPGAPLYLRFTDQIRTTHGAHRGSWLISLSSRDNTGRHMSEIWYFSAKGGYLNGPASYVLSRLAASSHPGACYLIENVREIDPDGTVTSADISRLQLEWRVAGPAPYKYDDSISVRVIPLSEGLGYMAPPTWELVTKSNSYAVARGIAELDINNSADVLNAANISAVTSLAGTGETTLTTQSYVDDAVSNVSEYVNAQLTNVVVDAYTRDEANALFLNQYQGIGTNSFECGDYAIAAGEESYALGFTTEAYGDGSVAWGAYALATNDNAFVFGPGLTSKYNDTVHLNKLHLFGVANDDPNSVLTREENDALYAPLSVEAQVMSLASNVYDKSTVNSMISNINVSVDAYTKAESDLQFVSKTMDDAVAVTSFSIGNVGLSEGAGGGLIVAGPVAVQESSVGTHAATVGQLSGVSIDVTTLQGELISLREDHDLLQSAHDALLLEFDDLTDGPNGDIPMFDPAAL